jgi:hypothetical protein
VNTDVAKALIYGLSAIITVSIWSYTSRLNLKTPQFSIETSLGGLPFLIESRSGTVWRYYRNTDAQQNITSEGFTLVTPTPMN